MTNQPRRPSLLQASSPNSHAHSSHKQPKHSHGHDQHHHNRQHHQQSDDINTRANPNADADADSVSDSAPASNKNHHRQQPVLQNRGPIVPEIDHPPANVVTPNLKPLVTQVIQTVSLVQIVDTAGSPVGTQTRYGLPNTIVVDTSSGKTVTISHPDTTPTHAAPGSSPQPSSQVSSVSLNSSETTPTHATTISPPSKASSSPSTPLSVFPTLSDAHNQTFPHSIHKNSTSSFHVASKNATFSRTSHTISTTTTSFISTTRISSSSLSESLFVTFTSDGAVPTDGVIGGNGNGAGGDSAPSPTPAPSPGVNLTPQQKQVIGGVVGSVAGVAFVAILLLLALKYKRRRDNGALLGTIQSGPATRGLPPTTGDPGNGGGGGNGGAMAERYGPAAITAALAGLANKRRSSAPDTSSAGERGFYRVSGRKLPSVLTSGGDGYSDPRESFMSGNSDYYRGSQAFDPIQGGATRLALGSPMRPVSGVPIMRYGPARTAVTERNPFSDHPNQPPSTPPGSGLSPSPGLRESPGRQGSRFQESI